MILVTGGAGFIGANFVLDWLAQSTEPIINLDRLTYAGNLETLAPVLQDHRHVFVHGDICDTEQTARLLARYQPRAIVHFAAESHVDRSILGPAEFVRTNLNGTFSLLEASRNYWSRLEGVARDSFRFLHVSTDEVFGSLTTDDAPFSEESPYAPNSPYSASKAGSDHLVRAYHQTYGLPTLTTHCSNNYGPYQFPEKLIPLMLTNATAGKHLPVYGDGMNVRDWLYVGDHCAALRIVLDHGEPGENYNIGGWNEKSNIDVVRVLCDILEREAPRPGGYWRLVEFVTDRPGHDRRYAIDASKIENTLGWRPLETFDSGMEKTVRWYLDHPDWVRRVLSGDYRRFISQTGECVKAQDTI